MKRDMTTQEFKDENAEQFGKYLFTLLANYFNSISWYEKSYDRNKVEVLVMLEKLTVMTCSGYDDRFNNQLMLKLDLYKLGEYNPGYKKLVKHLRRSERRYYVFNAKWFFQETLRDLVKWDLDVPAYLAQALIEEANKVTKPQKTR